MNPQGKEGQMHNLDTFLAAAGEAQSLDDIWVLLSRCLKSRGFRAVSYLLFDKGLQHQASLLLEDGFPQVVINRFAELGYGRNAPVLRIAMRTGQPQLASRALANHKLSREEQDHHAAMTNAGLQDVLVLPLYGPLGRDALVVLGDPSAPELFDSARWTEPHMIAQMAHLRTVAMLPERAETQHDLSMRELEILRWVAQGKSNSAIADILGISSGTVDTYLRRLFDKLGVADRTSAAVKGVSLGLISA